MAAEVDHRPLNASLALLFVATVACSVALAVWTPYREAGTILLFLPLLSAYMLLRPWWMVAFGAATAVVRVGLEAIFLHPAAVHGQALHVGAEAVFPIILYVALGLAFYYWRARQTALARKLAETETARSLALLSRSLAHDFRNSLTVVLGTAKLLRDTRRLDDVAAEYVDSIVQAAEDANRLVERMSDYSRLSAPQMERCDLRELARRRARSIESVVPEGVDLVCRGQDGPLLVRADPALLSRVLLNLCKNAWEAMPDGGRIAVRTFEQSEGDRRWACLAVADTGPGVDPKVGERVFDPFYTDKERPDSTGLGLSNCRAILVAHGGELVFRNREEGGAEFVVRLPTASERAGAAAGPADRAAPDDRA